MSGGNVYLARLSKALPIATNPYTKGGTSTADKTTLAIIWPRISSAIGNTP